MLLVVRWIGLAPGPDNGRFDGARMALVATHICPEADASRCRGVRHLEFNLDVLLRAGMDRRRALGDEDERLKGVDLEVRPNQFRSL
jgi:hypothetical protein